jgi:hypothetical protein
MKLDDRYVGLEDGAEISVEVREVTRPASTCSTPGRPVGDGRRWSSGPAPGALLAQYAQALVLHPRDITAARPRTSRSTRRCRCRSFNLSRDGTKDDVWKVVFKIYPDLTKLPANPYGKVGP